MNPRPRSPRIIGVDASPTASGIALPDGSVEVWHMPGVMDAGAHTGERLVEVFRRFSAAVVECRPDVMVIENYNMGMKKFGPAFQIGEVGGIFRLVAAQAGVPMLSVSPAARAQFGCGNGGAAKKTVKTTWTKLTGVSFPDDNAADAHILREMGHWLIGGSGAVSQLPPKHLEALTKVKAGQREIIDLVRAALKDEAAAA